MSVSYPVLHFLISVLSSSCEFGITSGTSVCLHSKEIMIKSHWLSPEKLSFLGRFCCSCCCCHWLVGSSPDVPFMSRPHPPLSPTTRRSKASQWDDQKGKVTRGCIARFKIQEVYCHAGKNFGLVGSLETYVTIIKYED